MSKRIQALKMNEAFITWGTLLFLSLIWGTSFFLIKKSLVAFSFLEVAGLRVASAGVCCLPFFFHFLKKIPVAKRKIVFLLGFISTLIPAFLFSLAQTNIDSSITGILNTFSPIWTLIIGVLFFGVKGTRQIFVGTALGLLGAILLIVKDEMQFDIQGAPYMGLVLLATISYGLTSNIVKFYVSDVKPMALSIVSYGFLTIPCVLFLMTTDFYSNFQNHPAGRSSMLAVMFLGIFSTAICSFIFYWLIQRTNQVFASYVAYIMPIVAILLGALDGEQILFIHIGGFILIIIGLWISQRKRKLKKVLPAI